MIGGYIVNAPDSAEILGGPTPEVSPDRQAVSVAGWMFDAREFGAAPASSPADLDPIVMGLTSSARACAALGFSYLPVMIPAKRVLVNVTPSGDRGWVAELNARLRDVDDVELMSLFGVLRHAHRHGHPYHRTDADWNDLGAFFVARALLKEAHKRVPALRPSALADLHLRAVDGYLGTLADAPKLALLDGELVPCEQEVEGEQGVVIDASRLHARRMPVESDLADAGPSYVRVYANPVADEDSHVAVVGDSAALPVVRWLAESTRRTTLFSSQDVPCNQLELETPPVVIHLLRETDLQSGWPAERPAPPPTPPARL